MRVSRALLALQLAALPVAAQNADSTTWTRFIVNSKKLGEERPIYVATPAEYRPNADRFPVLVLLDANDVGQFVAARANIRFLTSRNAIPPLIIVGIPNTKDRTHDLTPKLTASLAQRFPTAGGADDFADFITDELLPVIRSKYRTNSATILAGHSFGGLFALHVAATRPGTFAGVIAMSPSLQWNDSAVIVTYSNAIARATAKQRIFATSGGLEPPVIDRTTKHFAARMDSLKPMSTVFAYRFYPENTHALTPAPSLTDGLRFVFAPLTAALAVLDKIGEPGDSATVVNTLAESEAQYARAAKSLGLPERFPEMALNMFGYAVMLRLKQPALAVLIFRRNVERYPDSANVYDSLGDGFLSQGDSAAAKVQFRKAVEVATRTGDPILPESQAKLDALAPSVQAGKPKP